MYVNNKDNTVSLQNYNSDDKMFLMILILKNLIYHKDQYIGQWWQNGHFPNGWVTFFFHSQFEVKE